MKATFRCADRGQAYRYLWLMRSLFLVFLLLAARSATAQRQKPSCLTDCSCDMAGRVVDQLSRKPLAYATVQLKGTSEGTIADEDGVFHLHNLCSDEFDLVVSFVGYKSLSHHHDLYHADPVIYLSPDDALLESVVVEGVRPESGMISVTATTISPEEISSRRGERLGDILGRISGVSILTTGQNVVKPVIHGLHSSRILIINNGIRHESQSWGAEHAPEIDPTQADNIRLIKGAASVKYGPGALGGVIVINPVQAQLASALKGSTDLTLQSNGRSVGATAMLQQGYSSFAWVAQAAGRFQGDLHTPKYMLSNTGAREWSATAGALYHKRKLDLKLHYSYFEQTLGLLRGSVVGNLRDLANAMGAEIPAYTADFSYTINTPHQEAKHHLLTLSANWNLSNSQLSLQYGFQANNRKEFDVRRGTNNLIPSINLDLFTHSLEADWQHPVWGIFTGTAGVQAQFQDNNNIAGTNTTPFLPNFNSLNLGAYIAESIEWGNTTLDAGLRYDLNFSSVRGRTLQQEIFRDELNFQSLTASTGFFRPLGRNASLHSNLGLAWRPPNMAELYSFGKHEWIVEYGLWRFLDGKTGVFTQTEKAVNSELSYKWINTYAYEHNRLDFEVSGYMNYIRNYIYTRPAGLATTVRGAFPLFVYDQTNALLAGLDGRLGLAHSSSWESELKLSFLYVTDVEKGERFVGIPPNRLTYALGYTKATVGAFKNLRGSLETAYTFRQYLAPPVISPREILAAERTDPDVFAGADSGFDFRAAPEGYLLFNFSGGIDKGKFSYRLRIHNILNSSYREYTNRLRYFADEPGRNFVISAKYSF